MVEVQAAASGEDAEEEEEEDDRRKGERRETTHSRGRSFHTALDFFSASDSNF